MACENLSKYYPIVINFQGTFPHIQTRVQLILDTTGRTFKRDMGPKWGTTNCTAEVNNLLIAGPEMEQMS